MQVSEVIENHKIDSNSAEWDPNDLDRQQSDGDALIHWVARYGTVQEMECLIKSGAALEIRGDIGRTALAESIAFKNFMVASYLLNNGANALAVDDYDDSILDLAVHSENQKIISEIQNHINKIF